MKKPYERPSISKTIHACSNKFAVSNKIEIIDQIDGISIKSLVEDFGSPLFVFSESKIKQQYQKIQTAFKKNYPHFQLAWSYKTNYLQAICSIFHQQGSIAEVVSDFEYEKALKLGIEPLDILYNGPFKTIESLKKAVKGGSRIHIDNIDEIIHLEKISQELSSKPKVALRINMDTGIYPAWTRFGFNLENGEAEYMLQRIIKSNKMDIVGLHTHIGTFVLSPDAYCKAVRKLIDLYKKIQQQHSITLEYIDLGGGFPSSGKLKAQYLPNSVLLTPLEEYAEKITYVLRENFQHKEGPKLYLETGRALIDDAGYMITTVQAKHRLPDNRNALIVDAGINCLFTSQYFDIHVYPTQPYVGTLENMVLYGPLCMNMDVLRESVQLPHLNVGDRLVLNPVGAYNVTQWMQFIHMRPAVVLISSNKKPYLIRRKESLQDVEAAEILPDQYRLLEEES
ncbi:MAG: diaminopimelate decarboxylase [Candidatus Brocadiae bacterium]|nr:diaminopimelate decarboxylase [Candidatus Brocadiia bacterium]